MNLGLIFYIYYKINSLQASYHIDTLHEDEIAFIQKKYTKESKAFMLGINAMLIASVSIPLVVGMYYFFTTRDKNLLYNIFFIGLGIFLAIVLFIAFFSYISYILPLKKDLSRKEKIVEQVTIQSALYVKQFDTYHFYIYSLLKVSIEVSEDFYNAHQVGDEINIEYSRYSKEYVGYF